MAWQILAHAHWPGLGQHVALKATHIVMTELHGLTSVAQSLLANCPGAQDVDKAAL
jgi:hypothetical protein